MFNETERSKEELELKIKESREFYKNNLCTLPSFPNWRQFRLRLWKTDAKKRHMWVKVPGQVKNAKELQKWLIKFAPRDVYFTTSRFLNPSKVGPRKWNHKPGYKWGYNLFLGSELYFDFDDKKIQQVKGVCDILTKREFVGFGYEKIKVYETSRGYHIHVLDFEEKTKELQDIKNKVMTPWNREQKYLTIKKQIATYISSKGLQFDMPITFDTRRIIRLPGSLQADGFVVKEVKL